MLLPSFVLAQAPTQKIRGTVLDAQTLQPLIGATVSLPDAEAPFGTVTDGQGRFIFSKVPIGRYRIQVDYLGYGTLTIAEVQVEAGRETVQNIQLWEQPEALGEVVVRAQGKQNINHPASIYTLTVEEQFRYPATFFDPARVVTSYPGVVAPADQANHISVRGNSPNALRWRLEGADIVNPNHTANAGTFSDRPSSAGGGVSILSAQVLGTSNFLTGAFPSGYGNSIGGVMDMNFRKGNNGQRQYVAQAGVIGFDVAAEGPLTTDTSLTKENSPSFLVNYRYSFTGLLTSLGVDFGGEEIGFQDLSFHLNFPTKNAGEFGVFGLGGASKNIFTSSNENPTEEKELYDIDFQSKMGAIGVTHVLPISQKSMWRTTVALSALEHKRTSERVGNVPVSFLWDDDDLTERKLSVRSVFLQKINSGTQFRFGLQVNQEHADFFSFAESYQESTGLSGTVDEWLVQPFAEWQKRLSERLEMTLGVHLSHFTFSEKTMVEPRASFSFLASSRAKIYGAYGLHSQAQLPQVQALARGGRRISPTRSHHAVLGYRQNLSASWSVTVEAYHQSIFEVPISLEEGRFLSALNWTEFTEFSESELVNRGRGRNYGLDLSIQKYWKEGSFVMVSGSWYRSLFSMGEDGEEFSTRWDGRYLVSMSSGRERSKKTKKGKTRTFGNSSRLLWMGGFRERPISEDFSSISGRTRFEPGVGFSNQLNRYIRLDWRFYFRWEKPGRTSLLSLDIQNLLFTENEAFNYYDQVTGGVELKKQLGFIPVLSWRTSF